MRLLLDPPTTRQAADRTRSVRKLSYNEETDRLTVVTTSIIHTHELPPLTTSLVHIGWRTRQHTLTALRL